jgi:hypothetical protein
MKPRALRDPIRFTYDCSAYSVTLYIPLHGHLKYIQYNATISTVSTATSAGQKHNPMQHTDIASNHHFK